MSGRVASKGRLGMTKSEWSQGHQYSSESGDGSWDVIWSP